MSNIDKFEKLSGQHFHKKCFKLSNQKIIEPVIEDFIEGLIENNTVFANTVIQLYKLLEVKQENGSSYVRINPQMDIAQFKSFDKGKSRITKLYQIITGITSYPDRNHIGLSKTICQSLSNQQVN